MPHQVGKSLLRVLGEGNVLKNMDDINETRAYWMHICVVNTHRLAPCDLVREMGIPRESMSSSGKSRSSRAKSKA